MSAEKQKTILLVEDEAIIAMAEKMTLEKFGYNVIIAGSGEEAVTTVAATPGIDLILMDINLGSGMDGTEAAALILKERDLPVVFLSSHTEPEVVEKTEKITSYGYVVKDSSGTVLDASIKMAFKLFEAKEREKEKEAALAHSRGLMQYVIEHMSSAVAVHDRDLRYIFVSQRYLDEYKLKERDIIGKYHYDVFPDLPQKWRDVHRRALAGEISRAEDDPYQRQDGSLEWTRWECRPWYEADGSIGGIIVYTEVTTERKLAELKLAQNLDLLTKLARLVPGVIYQYRLDPDGRSAFPYASPGMNDIYEVTPEEVRDDATPVFARLHPGDYDRVAGAIQASALTLNTFYCEFRVLLPRQGLRWRWSQAHPERLADGGTLWHGIISDITERKLAEEALRASQLLVEEIINTISVRVFWKDMNLVYLGCNTAFARDAGYADPKDIIGKDDYQMTWRDQADLYRRDDRQVIESGCAKPLIEEPQTTPEGLTIHLLTSKMPLRDAKGEIVGVLGTYMEITERQQAEEALKASEARAQALLSTIPDMLFRVDRRGVFQDYRADVRDLYAQSEPTLIGKNCREVLPPEVVDMMEGKIRAALESGALQTFEYKLPVPGKGVRDFEARMIASGTDEVTAIVRDVTESHRAESQKEAALAALRESEERMRAIVEGTPHLFFYTQDAAANTIYVSPTIEQITGYKPDVWLKRRDWFITDAAINREAKARTQAHLRGEFPGEPVLLEIHHALGHEILLEIYEYPITKDGRIVGLQGVAHDITERKQAQEALRTSEAKQSNALQMTQAGHWEYDVDRDLFTFNDNFYRIFRTTAAAVGGYQLSSGDYARRFCHPDDAVQVGEETQGAIASPDPNYSRQIEHRILYADGEVGHIAVRFFIVKDAQGRTIKTYGVNQDITERKRAEEEVKRQLAEKEILLKEVHHRIKNNFASIGGLLSLHMQAINSPETVAALQDAIGRVDSMRLLYEKLLLGGDFRDASAKNYIESLAASVVSLFPDLAKVKLNLDIDDFTLDPKRLFPLGIIINELLTNIMKHAFAGKKSGTIKLSLAKDGARVTLNLEDNGIGLPSGFDISASKGFGLMLVKMLSQQLGGSFSIEKHKGTRSRLEFGI